MKTYLKLLLAISIAILTASSVNAQNFFPLKYSPELFLGKWTATHGDMSYEVEFTTKVIANKSNDELECVLGKITYRKNGTIVKKTEYNNTQSIIYGGMRSTKKARLNFFDEERLVWWEFDFTIDENNSSRAVWKFTKAKGGWMDMGWNETNSPDIPDNLVFTKVPVIVAPGNPGNPIDPGAQL